MSRTSTIAIGSLVLPALMVLSGISSAAIVKLTGSVAVAGNSDKPVDFDLLVEYEPQDDGERQRLQGLSVTGAFSEVQYDPNRRLLTLRGGRSQLQQAELVVDWDLEDVVLASGHGLANLPISLSGFGNGDDGWSRLSGVVCIGPRLRAPEPSSLGLLAAAVAGCAWYALRARRQMPQAKLTA
jgi:hypothetical protein